MSPYDPAALARLGPVQRAAMDTWAGTGASWSGVGPLFDLSGDLRRDLAWAMGLEARRIAKIRAEEAYRRGTARYPVPPQLADRVAQLELRERAR